MDDAFILVIAFLLIGIWAGTFIPEITPEQMEEAKQRCKNSQVEFVDKAGIKCSDGLRGTWKDDDE